MTTMMKAEDVHLIAGSIVLAAVIIGFSIIIDNADRPLETQHNKEVPVNILSTTQPVNADAVRPVSADDHIRGDENAPITIIEYSDLECPFCNMFHPTMQRVVAENSDVRWVYRHFPLVGLHQKARGEAIAAECAAALGGDGAFWTFVDRFFALSPANDRTDLSTVYPQIAQNIGIPIEDLEECIREERYADRVDRDIRNAQASGGQGTPWSVVMGPDGSMYGVSGARSFEDMSLIIEEIRQ